MPSRVALIVASCALALGCGGGAASSSTTGSGSGSGSGSAESDYVPAEFKTGADRWRDTGVYVDGVYQGVLAWAELPVALEPVWIETRASAPKRSGATDPGWKLVRERRYRVTDYLRAIGLDLATIKEIHLYGPKFSETIIATGADLRSPAADGFMFRFGTGASGKPLPVVPHGFGNGRSPDKVSAMMIYVTKPPPTLERNVGLVLDGQVTTGVPYYGTPHRGGVRVYLDDRLVAYLKRQDLPIAEATQVDDGDPRWRLLDILRGQGVAVETIAEAWIIRDERWRERIDQAALATAWFSAGMQAKGNITIGGPGLPPPIASPSQPAGTAASAGLKAQAIMLRTAPLPAARVPSIGPDEP
jgi:hypothetical protein